eukprot:CFRG1038T1
MANPSSFIGLNICLTLLGDGGLLEGKVSQIDPEGRYLVLSGRVLRNGNPLKLREIQVENSDITHLELAPDRSYVEPVVPPESIYNTPAPPPQSNPFPSNVTSYDSTKPQTPQADPAIITMVPYAGSQRHSAPQPYVSPRGRTQPYQSSTKENRNLQINNSPLKQTLQQAVSSPRGRGKGRGRVRNRDYDRTIHEAQPQEYEFDFEGNLNKFNKAAVFAEIEQDVNLNAADLLVSHNVRGKNYKYYENILGSDDIQQEVYPAEIHPSSGFRTEYGVAIPYATCFQMQELYDILQTMGFTRAQILENAASSVCTMVLKLLGGSRRINPKNMHQVPVVVVLAGPGNTGASSIATARHLSSHGVSVYLCTSDPPSHWSETFKNQFNLFLYTDGQYFDDVNQMNAAVGETAIDLVIDGICGFDLDSSPSDFATDLMDWAAACDVNIISIDLPSGMNGDTGEFYDEQKYITPQWIVALGLPVAGLRNTECQARFLADIGLPSASFAKAGIDEYNPPFGDNVPYKL